MDNVNRNYQEFDIYRIGIEALKAKGIDYSVLKPKDIFRAALENNPEEFENFFMNSLYAPKQTYELRILGDISKLRHISPDDLESQFAEIIISMDKYIKRVDKSKDPEDRKAVASAKELNATLRRMNLAMNPERTGAEYELVRDARDINFDARHVDKENPDPEFKALMNDLESTNAMLKSPKEENREAIQKAYSDLKEKAQAYQEKEKETLKSKPVMTGFLKGVIALGEKGANYGKQPAPVEAEKEQPLPFEMDAFQKIGMAALQAEGKTSNDPAELYRVALEKNPHEFAIELASMLKNPQHVTESDSASLSRDIMSLSKAKPEEMQDRLEKIMTKSSNFIREQDGHSTEGTQLIVDSAKELLKQVQKIVTTMNQKQMGKEPEPVKTEVEQPKVEQPKVEQPKVEQPKVEQPKVEQPKVEQPKAEQPKVEQPKVEQPKVEQPKVEQPKVEQPKVEQPRQKPIEMDAFQKIGMAALQAEGKTSNDPAELYRAALEKSPGEVASALSGMWSNPKQQTIDDMRFMYKIAKLDEVEPDQMQEQLDTIMIGCYNYIRKNSGDKLTEDIVDCTKKILNQLNKIVTTINPERTGLEHELISDADGLQRDLKKYTGDGQPDKAFNALKNNVYAIVNDANTLVKNPKVEHRKSVQSAYTMLKNNAQAYLESNSGKLDKDKEAYAKRMVALGEKGAQYGMTAVEKIKAELSKNKKQMDKSKRFGRSNSELYENVRKAEEKALGLLEKYKNPTKAQQVEISRAFKQLQNVSQKYMDARKGAWTDKGQERYQMIEQANEMAKKYEKEFPLTRKEIDFDNSYLKAQQNDQEQYQKATGMSKELFQKSMEARTRLHENYLNENCNYEELKQDIKTMMLAKYVELSKNPSRDSMEVSEYLNKMQLPVSLSKITDEFIASGKGEQVIAISCKILNGEDQLTTTVKANKEKFEKIEKQVIPQLAAPQKKAPEKSVKGL